MRLFKSMAEKEEDYLFGKTNRNMKGSHKFWLAVLLAVLVRVLIFAGMYYYDNWSTSERLRGNTFGVLIVYSAITSFMLITAYEDYNWDGSDIKPLCYAVPLFYIWMLVYYINRLTNKYLT